MKRIKRVLSIALHKIFGVPYRSVIAPYEIENILTTEDAWFHLTVGRNGIIGILPGHSDEPKKRAAGLSLAYFLSRELYDFDLEIQKQLRKLEQLNVSRPTPHLDALLEETTEDIEPSLLTQFEQQAKPSLIQEFEEQLQEPIISQSSPEYQQDEYSKYFDESIQGKGLKDGEE